MIFGSLYYYDLLRINKDTEYSGCDIPQTGEAAYPASAWKENQYDQSATNENLPIFIAPNTTRRYNEDSDSDSKDNDRKRLLT